MTTWTGSRLWLMLLATLKVLEQAMDPMKFYRVGHERHVFCNPLNSDKTQELVALLDLEAGAQVLDIACGKGELLRRLCDRYGIVGVGLDIEPSWITIAQGMARAQGLADSIEYLVQDGADYVAAHPATALNDVSMCIGASWIWQGHRGTLRALAGCTRAGGIIVVGEPFWRREPTPAYLEASELSADMCGSHTANVAVGTELGLTFLYAVVSNEDDWDRYEGYQWHAIETYAREHPDDPDGAELVARVRRDRDAYLRWGRSELGWAVYVFRT